MAGSSLIKNTALDGTAFVVVQHLLAEPVDDHRPVDPEQKVAHSPRHPAEHLLNLLPADIGFDLERVRASCRPPTSAGKVRIVPYRTLTLDLDLDSRRRGDRRAAPARAPMTQRPNQ